MLRLLLMGGFLVTFLTGCIERTFIFFPSRYPAGNWNPSGLAFEDAWFQTEDDVKLHGWFVAADQPSGYVLFAHGNAGNLSDRVALIRTLSESLGLSVMIFDYRGYGRSQGSPSIQGILKDGRAARQWLSQRADIKPDQIILMGRSLGSSVVVHMAAEQGARALILESAFSSLTDVADHAYPWLPARLLLKQDIKADELIRHYHGPLFQSHGTVDRIIPIELGRKIFAAANEPKKFLSLPGLDHNDLPHSGYYQEIGQFLRLLSSPEK